MTQQLCIAAQVLTSQCLGCKSCSSGGGRWPTSAGTRGGRWLFCKELLLPPPGLSPGGVGARTGVLCPFACSCADSDYKFKGILRQYPMLIADPQTVHREGPIRTDTFTAVLMPRQRNWGRKEQVLRDLMGTDQLAVGVPSRARSGRAVHTGLRMNGRRAAGFGSCAGRGGDGGEVEAEAGSARPCVLEPRHERHLPLPEPPALPAELLPAMASSQMLLSTLSLSVLHHSPGMSTDYGRDTVQ